MTQGAIFDSESDLLCDINISRHSYREFENKGTEYLINEKDLDDLPSHSIASHPKDPNPTPLNCNHDMRKVKHVQQ